MSSPELMDLISNLSPREIEHNISPEVISDFERFIVVGSQLIKDGKFSDAMEHFKNEQELTKVGGQISSEPTTYTLFKLPDRDKYDYLADVVAENSRCGDRKNRKMELSTIDYYPKDENGTLQNRNQDLPKELQHEISLIYLEEWLHTLQMLKRKPLEGHNHPEIDVAIYMRKNGIPMTKAFLRRYDREEVISKIKV